MHGSHVFENDAELFELIVPNQMMNRPLSVPRKSHWRRSDGAASEHNFVVGQVHVLLADADFE